MEERDTIKTWRTPRLVDFKKLLIVSIAVSLPVGSLWFWQRHCCKTAERRASEVLATAFLGRYSDIRQFNPKLSAELEAREAEVGKIEDYKLIGSSYEVFGAPIAVDFSVQRSGRWYREGLFTDSPPKIDNFNPE